MKKLVFMFVAIAAMSFAVIRTRALLLQLTLTQQLLLTQLTALLQTLLQLLQTQLLLRLSNR